MKGFYISVKNDLLEEKHFSQMGKAVWLYLWLLDKMTSINEAGEGKVLGGRPIKYEEVGLGFTARTYGSQIKQLQKYEYIKAVRTPYGYVFTVYKAKKYFSNDEIRKKGKSIEIRKKGRNKEDNTAYNTNTLSELRSGSDLTPNGKENMNNWNRTGDADDTVVDYETGEVKSTAPVSKKKYPNAIVVIKLFQEILGLNQTFWKKSPAILEACERLYTERGVEKIRNALEFYKENREDKYCPQITSPKKLEEKYADLSLYKNKKT